MVGAFGKVFEQEMTPEVCAVTSDTWSAPKCVPRNTNDSSIRMIFFLTCIWETVDERKLNRVVCCRTYQCL